MLLATWNVNSIKARHDRVMAWLQKRKPDVVCLQELKLISERFPYAEVEALGYHASVFGQKTYNGVAILSKEQPTFVRQGMEDGVEDDHSRLITTQFAEGPMAGATILCGYFPNGGDMHSDKYTYKLDWLDRLREYLDKHFENTQPLALCGDFNVAVFADDVARPKEFEGCVLANPQIRDALRQVQDFGFEDVFRPFFPHGGVYTWWDYRGMGFDRNNGLRIDHIYCTPSLAKQCIGAMVDRSEREGKGASDHAPVMAEFEFTGAFANDT